MYFGLAALSRASPRSFLVGGRVFGAAIIFSHVKTLRDLIAHTLVLAGQADIARSV